MKDVTILIEPHNFVDYGFAIFVMEKHKKPTIKLSELSALLREYEKTNGYNN